DLDSPADDDEERTLVAFMSGVLAGAEAKIGGRLRDALELVWRDTVGEQRQRGELGDGDHGRTRTVSEAKQILEAPARQRLDQSGRNRLRTRCKLAVARRILAHVRQCGERNKRGTSRPDQR